MGIYLMNLISIFYWNMLIKLTKIKNNNLVFTIIMSIQLFLISALRDINVGADTLTYVRRFKIISNTNWRNIYKLPELVDFELGYVILNKIIGSIYLNERFFLIVSSFIIIFSISYYIYNNSKNIWLSYFVLITLGYWGSSFNVIRQYIAIAIIIHSFKYVVIRNLLRFSTYIIIASFFHTSALSLFIIYPLYKFEIKKTYITFMVFLLFIIHLFSSNIIYLLMELFGYMHLSSRLDKGSGYGMLILLTVFLAVAIIYRKNNTENIEVYDLYIHLLFIAVALNILAIEFSMFGRAMIYYTIGNIILMPNIIESIDLKYEKITGIVVLISGLTYFYIFKLLDADTGAIVPYIFMKF